MYFEIPISSLHAVNSCYTLATTDFDVYKIPLSPLKFRGGEHNDVILPFSDIDQAKQYLEVLYDKSVGILDTCLKDKYRLVTTEITNFLQLQKIAEGIHQHNFKVVGSVLQWKFKHEDTLSIVGAELNQVRYQLNQRNGRLFVDTNPSLFGEQLEVQSRVDDQIELITEYSRVIKVVLQPDTTY